MSKRYDDGTIETEPRALRHGRAKAGAYQEVPSIAMLAGECGPVQQPRSITTDQIERVGTLNERLEGLRARLDRFRGAIMGDSTAGGMDASKAPTHCGGALGEIEAGVNYAHDQVESLEEVVAELERLV